MSTTTSTPLAHPVEAHPLLKGEDGYTIGADATWQPGETPIIVKHRDGWCAIKPGVPLDEDAWKDYTLCDHEVACRTASDVGMPDCPECFDRLEALAGPAHPGLRLRASVLAELTPA